MRTILLLLLLLLSCNSYAATINAVSCSQTDVQAAVTTSISGDIVNIPSGTCSWESAITINKSIVVKGQTTTSRNVTTYIVTPTDNTIIQKNGLTITATNNVRVTGITFDGNVTGKAAQPITLPQSPVNVRIDHNHISHYSKTWNKGSGGGYLNVIFDNNRVTQPAEENLYIVGKGNTSWTDGEGCGNAHPEKTTWIEENEWVLDTANCGNPIDSGEGARFVIRHNLFTGSAQYSWTGNLVEMHGHCWGQRDGVDNAGAYCAEISNNIIANPANPSYTGQNLLKSRAGKSYVYNNYLKNTGWNGSMVVYWIQEVLTSCNSTPCAVQAHEDMGLHSVPLSEASNYSGGLCTTYPCPMQPNNSYVFGNTRDSGSTLVGIKGADAETFMKQNRDYWSTATVGTASNKPASCSINDCYFASDSGELYRCVATNQWELVYVAYTYPHIIRALNKPTSIRIVGG